MDQKLTSNSNNNSSSSCTESEDQIKKRRMNESLKHTTSAPAPPVTTKSGVSFDAEALTNSSHEIRTVNSLYEMGEELGRGAFSTVYKARNRETNEYVAVKVIQLSSFTEKERLRQEKILENEIKIMNRIMTNCDDTTNLIQIKDVVREHSRLAIVMEILEGKELFDRIVERQRYTEKDAAQLMHKIIKAIQTMHKAGILHRDLKPENLVFTSSDADAEVKITDFGLAMIESEPDVHKTVVGTPNYVAPEVVSINPRGPFYGRPCDVWSMGVILYILLVGYPPFYHENVRELFKQIRRGDFEFHEDQWKNISVEAIDLVKKMLNTDPKRRYTCEQVLAHPWMANAPSAELSSTQQQMKKLNARRRFKAVAMAVVWGTQLGLRRKLLNLVENTNSNVFNLDELQRIRASFQLHAMNGKMDKVAFHATMKRLGFEDVPIDKLFELFDHNGDGTLDYKEFLGSLSTLRQSGESAMKMCFQIYDDQNKGSLSKQDIARVLRIILRDVDSYTFSRKLENIFEKLDTDKDGEVSYEEFKAGIFSEPVLVQAFLEPMDGIGTLPPENFTCSDMDRGMIDPRYLVE